jgi:hypothetical protein
MHRGNRWQSGFGLSPTSKKKDLNGCQPKGFPLRVLTPTPSLHSIPGLNCNKDSSGRLGGRQHAQCHDRSPATACHTGKRGGHWATAGRATGTAAVGSCNGVALCTAVNTKPSCPAGIARPTPVYQQDAPNRFITTLTITITYDDRRTTTNQRLPGLVFFNNWR